jgi:hypothetical protein
MGARHYGSARSSSHGAEAPVHLQVENRPRRGRFSQEAHGATHNVTLSLHIANASNRPSEQVRRHDCPRHLKMLHVMPKSADVNYHGRNAVRFEDPRGVSHGHVADWSSGH